MALRNHYVTISGHQTISAVASQFFASQRSYRYALSQENSLSSHRNDLLSAEEAK